MRLNMLAKKFEYLNVDWIIVYLSHNRFLRETNIDTDISHMLKFISISR